MGASQSSGNNNGGGGGHNNATLIAASSPRHSGRSNNSGGRNSQRSLQSTFSPLPSRPGTPLSIQLDEKVMMNSLHDNLMQAHKKRNPMSIFEVVQLLGEGSMGSVSKVRKRPQAVGGSARPEFVRKHANCCFLWLLQPFLPKSHPSKLVTSPYPSMNNLYEQFQNAASSAVSPNPSRHGRSNNNSNTNNNNNSGSNASAGADKDHVGTGKLLISPLKNTDTTADVSVQSIASSMISTDRRKKKEKYYALKSIHLSRCSTDQFKSELKNEVAILKGLDHPNIVKAMETFDYRDRLYLVLEICTGGDLYGRDPYTEQQACQIIKSVLCAVSYLHSKAIVHRDLKFENIMFASPSKHAEVKLIDFGLSQKFAADQHLHDAVGTVYTMAPELLQGDYDAKADVWSVGVIAFMLLSSSMPFYGPDRRSVIKSILRGSYHFSSRRWFYVSADAKRFVKALLRPDPALRPTADEARQQTAWLERSFDAHGNAPEVDMMDRVQATMQSFCQYGKLKKLALMVIAYKSTSEEIGYLRDMFHKFDTQFRGEIHLDEFKAVLSEEYDYTEEEMEAMFTGMDLDGTGAVHYCEFLAATMEAHGSIHEERLAEAFDRIDADDTGYITAQNLKAFLGPDVPDAWIEDIISEADVVDGDSRIDYQEFLALWNAEGDAALRNAERSVHSRRAAHNVSSRQASVVSSLSSGEESDDDEEEDELVAALQPAIVLPTNTPYPPSRSHNPTNTPYPPARKNDNHKFGQRRKSAGDALLANNKTPAQRSSFYYEKQKEKSVRSGGIWV